VTTALTMVIGALIFTIYTYNAAMLFLLEFKAHLKSHLKFSFPPRKISQCSIL